MNCPTKSGKYQCSKELGHAGACEASEEATTWTFGPFRDAWRGRAYLRGWLDGAEGGRLDSIGRVFDTARHEGEDDRTYCARIWGKATR